MTIPLYKSREITAFRQGTLEVVDDVVVQEKPLTLFVNHLELATIVCSPGGYEELGIGFLLSEGLISEPEAITSINCNEEGGLLWIETRDPLPPTDSFLRRHMASCCGKGRAILYFINDARQLKPVASNRQFSIGQLFELMALLEQGSYTFSRTGGVHSAALADDKLVCMYEDIGRHNAVDKVLGYSFMHAIDNSDKCLVISGRVASEILIKAARSRIPLVLSRSAPTELTIELAEDLNIAVVGFARGESLNIYSHAEKINL